LAAGSSSDSELRVSFPQSPDVTIVLGEIKSFHPLQKLVFVEGYDPLSYDYLVIGLGCTDHYHGVQGADQYSYGIQTFQAAREAFTALNNVAPLNISLINRGPRLLGGFPDGIQTYVAEWLIEHQVNVLLNTQLESIEQNTLYVQGSDNVLQTDITLWTAGIQPVSLVQQFQAKKDASGRLRLNEHYQLLDDPAIFVVGDCAALPFSPSAQVAGIQGEHIAHILLAIWKDKAIQVEAIKLRGTLGALGKHCGFGVMGSVSIKGRVPRLIKSGILWRSKHF
jgi:NADH dehydrogenase